jgi:PAS domain S-box-containing protein
MAKKPTYEELEQRVKKLTDELLERDQLKNEVERIFNFSMDMIGSGNLKGYFTRINSSFGKILGYSKKEILEKPFIKFVHDDDVEKTNQALTDAIKGKKEIYIENRYKCKDGTYKWIEWKVLVIAKEKKFIAVGRDVTERKHAEQSLARAEHEKNSILDSLFEHVTYMDLKMRILWANTAACKSLNLTRDEVIGRHCFKLWAGGSKPCSDCAVVEAMKTGQVQEVQKTTPDGRSWFNIGCPVKDDKNTITGGVEVSLDITELKKAEVFLRESEERYRSLAENSLVGIWQITLDGYTIYINPAMCRMLEIENPEVLNGKTYEFFGDDENLEIVKRELTKRKKGISSTYEVEIIGEKGTKRNVMISAAPIFLSEDKVHSTIGTFTDITDRKNAEKALIKAHNELEQRVKNRTKELETKKNSLEELNTAMKVLLKKREEDKIDIEKNVMTNVKELVWPYFEKIKKTKLDDQQRALLSITESNINEIVSPFTRTMSLKYLNLTPTEIRIANLIRHGSSTKKIAEIMKVSPRTVETHRKNIRRKIGLEGKRANLRSHLLSLH